MKAIKCLVIDDEELARILLKTYIDRRPGIELAGQFANPMEALPLLETAQIDLLFLDIQMPEITGISFLNTLTNPPLVIFTTAYAEYALQGYELNIIDYLLKPFSFERFLQAVNKATQLLSLRNTRPPEDMQTDQPASQSIEQLEAMEYILIKSEHKVFRIKLDDLLYIQSMREYVAYYQQSGRILSLDSLKSLEKRLPGDRFIRIHKSYIIAKSKVRALEGNLVHIGKEKIPIGASYREKVLEELF